LKDLVPQDRHYLKVTGLMSMLLWLRMTKRPQQDGDTEGLLKSQQVQ